MGLFDLFKKNSNAADSADTNSDGKYEIDDMSYIADMRHSTNGPWHQYDVRLAARGYGWDTMLDWADYMASADLKQISKASKAVMAGVDETDILEDYLKCKSFKETPSLQNENGALSIGGVSLHLGAPTMIVWINQAQFLRFFTAISDEDRMRRYVETMIRRTFNTPDEMKLAKPVPEEKPNN